MYQLQKSCLPGNELINVPICRFCGLNSWKFFDVFNGYQGNRFNNVCRILMYVAVLVIALCSGVH